MLLSLRLPKEVRRGLGREGRNPNSWNTSVVTGSPLRGPGTVLVDAHDKPVRAEPSLPAPTHGEAEAQKACGACQEDAHEPSGPLREWNFPAWRGHAHRQPTEVGPRTEGDVSAVNLAFGTPGPDAGLGAESGVP